MFPGLERQEQIECSICVDTSGSMSQQQLEEVLSEIVGLMDQFEEFKIDIWQFDTSVYGYEQFSKDTADELMRYQMKGGGGTSMSANYRFMKENGIQPKLFIVFTDLCFFGEDAIDPNWCDDTIWIINNSSHPEPDFGSWAYMDD